MKPCVGRASGGSTGAKLAELVLQNRASDVRGAAVGQAVRSVGFRAREELEELVLGLASFPSAWSHAANPSEVRSSKSSGTALMDRSHGPGRTEPKHSQGAADRSAAWRLLPLLEPIGDRLLSSRDAARLREAVEHIDERLLRHTGPKLPPASSSPRRQAAR